MTARQFIAFSLAILCFAYVACRAVLVGITYDEIWTLRDFVPQSYFQLWTYEACDANNHLLNSVLIKTLFRFFPNTLFVARLPNVIASLLYFWFSWKLSSLLNKWMAITSFALLLLNPFLLEFFSLARGYGLALGFTMGAIYYFVLYSKQQQLKLLVYELLFLGLALLSSFSVMHLVLGILGCNLIYMFKTKASVNWRNYLPLAVFVLVMTSLLYLPITRLKQNDSLYYGGNSGFYSDTLISLAKYYVGSMMAGWEITLLLNAFLILLGMAIYFLFRRAFSWQDAGTMLVLVTSITIASLYAQFFVLDNLFLIDRTAVFFYPLFFLILVFGWDLISNRNTRVSFNVFILSALCINTAKEINVSQTSIWFFDAKSKEVILALSEREAGAPTSLQCSWVLRKSLEYYRDHYFPQLELSDINVKSKSNNHQYYFYLNNFVDKVDYQKGREALFHLKKQLIFSYQPQGLELYQIPSK